MPYANHKGANQPAHPRSLINTFVVCCLDSIITPLVSILEISSLYLASVVAGLCLTGLQTPKTGFLMTQHIFNRWPYRERRNKTVVTAQTEEEVLGVSCPCWYCRPALSSVLYGPFGRDGKQHS